MRISYWSSDVCSSDLLAPNYPAGEDALAGFKRFYKGEVAMESYTPLSQLDYGTELSKMRASGADAVYIFLPGGLGVNFIKQFEAAGQIGRASCRERCVSTCRSRGSPYN